MDKILKNLNENDNLIDILSDCNNSLDCEYGEYTKNIEKTCNKNIKEAIIYSSNNKDINNYILKDHIIKHIETIIKNGLINIENVFLLMNIMNKEAIEYKKQILSRKINFEYINDLIGNNSKIYYDIDPELFNFCIIDMLIPFTFFNNKRKTLYECVNMMSYIETNLEFFANTIDEKNDEYTLTVMNTVLYLLFFYIKSLNIIDYKKKRDKYLIVINIFEKKDIKNKPNLQDILIQIKNYDIHLFNIKL